MGWGSALVNHHQHPETTQGACSWKLSLRQSNLQVRLRQGSRGGGRSETRSRDCLQRREPSTVLAATEVRGGHLVTRAEKGSRLWWVREWQVMEGREDVLTIVGKSSQSPSLGTLSIEWTASYLLSTYYVPGTVLGTEQW